LLEKNGYRFHPKRRLYISRDKKKIFSKNIIDDNDLGWLEGRAESVSENWSFYPDLSGKLKKEILDELGCS
tara:strand:+ start:52755 stop:52967 length:213 start_codon:yes stop_codon:yes gene_type:complete